MLLNVRLTSEEERAVRGLRRAKVNVSELVRRALREAAAREKKVKLKRSAVVVEIIESIPVAKARTKRPALDDRRAIAAFVHGKLAQK